MSITTTTALAANAAAFAPNVLAGTTSRNPFSAGVRRSETITDLDNSGGFLRVKVGDETGFEDQDTILVSGCTGDYEQFNGYHNVTGVALNYITTSTAWATATTGTFGTVYRWNANLFIKCVVYNDTPTAIATVYAAVQTDGTWSIDLAKPLQSELGSIFTLTTGEVSTVLCSHEYTVDVYESFQDKDLALVEVQDVSETQTTIAHRTTSYTTAQVSGTTLLNGNHYALDYVLLHFMTDQTSGVRISVSDYTSGALGSTVNYDVTTITNSHAAWLFAMPKCDYAIVQVKHFNGVTYDNIKDALTIKKAKSCSTVLFYTTRIGGYESYEFHDYEDTQAVDRVDYFVAESWQERTLQGVNYARSTYQNIRDLITSPDVYDAAGVKVKVSTDSMTYRAQLVEPVVKVRYDENYISQ